MRLLEQEEAARDVAQERQTRIDFEYAYKLQTGIIDWHSGMEMFVDTSISWGTWWMQHFELSQLVKPVRQVVIRIDDQNRLTTQYEDI